MKVLILGSSGWLAHYVIQELLQAKHEVHGISNSHRPLFDIPNKTMSLEDPGYLDLVKEFEGDMIINMLHSKNFGPALKVNNGVADICKEKGMHYVYCSSSNAIDGEADRDHWEKDLANGSSDYGKFKADGEFYLYDHFPEASILRFPAVHGFSPNSKKRTQLFLEKLQSGEKVVVDRDIIQNRPYAGHFAKMLVRIALQKSPGIHHIGTVDSGEEFDFMLGLAKAFGYSEEQVVSGKSTPHNMVVHPEKVFQLSGDEDLHFTQQDSIKALAESKELSHYKKGQ